MVENAERTYAGVSGQNLTEDNMTCTFDTVLYDSNGVEVKRIKHDYFALDPEFRNHVRVNMHSSDNMTVNGNDVNWDNGDMNISFYGTSIYDQLPAINSDGLTGSLGVENVHMNGVYNIFSETWTRKPSIISWDSRKRSYMNVGNNHSKATIDGEQYIFGNNDNTGTQYWIKNNELDFIHSFRNYDCADSWFGAGQWCYVEEYRAMILSSSSKVAIITPYSAHTKLPAPITKTNKDTMKITYDYYIQVPYSFSLTGDFLTPPPNEG